MPPKQLVHRGSALYAVINADSSWLGDTTPAAYRVFTDPPIAVEMVVEPKQGIRVSITPDMIIVVRATPKSPCVFHLVEFISRINVGRERSLAHRFYPWFPYVDFAWALVEHDLSGAERIVPTRVGLLCADKGKIKVIRRPERHPKAAEKSGETAKILLAELI